jgi:Activator of Hsp90 ATPase homolog 1-like protein
MNVDMGAWRQRLAGQVWVPLPPMQAFRLFTPLGERDWVPGWEPRFPAGAADDSEPGTAFVTDTHGQVRTWLVVEREVGRRIRYTNVAPGDRASLITVELAPVGTGSEVTVTYDITALSDTGARELRHFADGYARYLAAWQEQIVAYLGGGALLGQ